MWWWSWLLAIWALLTYWLVGNKWRWCWYCGIAQEFAWIAYGALTRQWGFLVTALAFIVVYARNHLRWKHTPSHTAVTPPS